MSERSPYRAGFVYLLYSPVTGLYKIGLSSSPDARRKQIEAEIRGMEWQTVCTIPTNSMRQLESAFHDAFADKRVGTKEWFQLSAAEVALFTAVAQTVKPVAEQRENVVAFPSETPSIRKFLDKWPNVIFALKKRRKALTASVYGEATVCDFNGHTVLLQYSAERIFAGRMASDASHLEELKAAMHDVFGVEMNAYVVAVPSDDRTSEGLTSSQQRVIQSSSDAFDDIPFPPDDDERSR